MLLCLLRKVNNSKYPNLIYESYSIKVKMYSPLSFEKCILLLINKIKQKKLFATTL